MIASLRSGKQNLSILLTLMPKSTSPADRVSDMFAAISTAADALFKHTTNAIFVREKANRATPTAALKRLRPTATSCLESTWWLCSQPVQNQQADRVPR